MPQPRASTTDEAQVYEAGRPQFLAVAQEPLVKLRVDIGTVVAYKLHMLAICRTEQFDRWLKQLGDTRAKAKVLVRLERLANGNPGDVAPVGEGLSEMRIDFGPGYRVYFMRHGETVTLLCGGTKDSQQGDIQRAKLIASELDE